MKKSPVIVCLLLFICFKDVTSYNNDNDPSLEDRIVGGHNISIEQVPYQVFLPSERIKGFGTCGGSIISDTCILTAAHCLVDVKKIHVVAGNTDSLATPKYITSSFMMHPSYKKNSLGYDVGIVKVPEGIKLDGVKTKKVKLAGKDTVLETGDDVLVTGWGLPYEDSPMRSQYLKGVKVPIISQSECKRLNPKVASTDFCAGYIEGGKDACQGDSGGPAVLTKTGVQVGIVAVGAGCARKEKPGMYTKVFESSILKFIKNHCEITTD